ncbi:MAG: SDR family NAD(P)-dependent oxidoreductase [Microthrixaceae bacterium]
MTVVLVTGANSDIGIATVKRLGERRVTVVGTVRSEESEQRLRDAMGAGGGPPGWLSIERLDVGDIGAGAALMKKCRPDVLVNNAGATLLGAVADVDFGEAEAQFRSTVLGPVFLARNAVAAGSCTRVVNIGSVVAEGVIPFTGWYGASKAALDVISDVWRVEAGPIGLEIVTVECGAIGTDVWDRAGDEVADDGGASTAVARQRWANLTDLAKSQFGDPEEVAEAIVRAALDPDPQPVVRVGFGARSIPMAAFLPRQLREPLTKAIFGLHDGLLARWSPRGTESD